MLYRRLNLIVVRGRGGRERRGGEDLEGRQGRVVSVVASKVDVGQLCGTFVGNAYI